MTPEFTGTCFRCNGLGHWAESTACPWLIKAATYNDHIARIDSLRDRYIDLVITVWQKTDYIKFENKLWHDGKVPSQLAR